MLLPALANNPLATIKVTCAKGRSLSGTLVNFNKVQRDKQALPGEYKALINILRLLSRAFFAPRHRKEVAFSRTIWTLTNFLNFNVRLSAALPRCNSRLESLYSRLQEAVTLFTAARKYNDNRRYHRRLQNIVLVANDRFINDIGDHDHRRGWESFLAINLN